MLQQQQSVRPYRSYLSKDIDISKPLHAYKIDSLLAMEFHDCVSGKLSADMVVLDLIEGSSLAAVSRTVAGKSLFLPSFGDEEHSVRI